MKILQLCRKFPYPLKDGESIAVTYLAKAYQELGVELTLLSFNTIKHYCDIDKLPASFTHYQNIQTSYLNNYPTLLGAFANLFTKESYHITRFISKDFNEKLIQILQNQSFDAIQLESVYFAPYIPILRQYSKAIIIMRAHNVEFEIWERVAAQTTFLPKKWYLQYLTQKLKRYEINQLQQYDLLLAMTQKDLSYFEKLGYNNARLVTPIGLELSKYLNRVGEMNRSSISFIGSLDWMPNQEGLSWFLEEVWSTLQDLFPNLELHIAGRNTPQWVYDKASKGIIVHGEIPDAKSFLLEHPFTIVPLFSGSGMRVKILEGMALGRVVITTTLGLEGIPAQDEQEVLIANNKEAFINKISTFLNNSQGIQTISQNARIFVEKHYDNKLIAEKVIQRIRKRNRKGGGLN